MDKRIYLFCLLFIIMCHGCKKKLNPPGWDSDYIFPVVNGNMNLNDLINDTLLSEEDGNVYFDLNLPIIDLDPEKIVKIPDTTVINSFSIPFGQITVQPGQQAFQSVEDLSYDLNEVQLRTAIIREGKIDFEVTSTLSEPVICVYRIPQATLNGIPFEVEEVVPAQGYSNSFDLSGYTLNLSGPNMDGFNTIETVFEVYTPADGNEVEFTNSDEINFISTFTDVVPDYVRGFFGQTTIDEQASTEVEIFNKLVDGTIELEDIEMNINITNGVGIDLRAIVNEFKGTNAQGNEVTLDHDIIGSVINMNRAEEDGNPVTPYVVDFPLNTSNSNIKDFFENLPNQVEYNLFLEVNPLGNISSSNDFYYYEAPFSIFLESKIPLNFIAQNLTLQDTIELNIGNGLPENPRINKGTLTLNYTNGFPLKTTLSMLIYDTEQEIITHTLMDEKVIEASDYDAFDNILSRSGEIKIPISSEELAAIETHQTLLLRVTFDSQHQPDYTELKLENFLRYTLIGEFNTTINAE